MQGSAINLLCGVEKRKKDVMKKIGPEERGENVTS
jgi:hypothetical protein